MPELTAKQQRFKEEFLVDLNATQAAIRAGYSEKTAYSQGQRLLKNVEVQAAIRQAMQERSERTQITQDQVLREFAVVGFATMGNYLDFGDDGQVRLDFSDLTPEELAVISEITQSVHTEGKGDDAKTVTRIKFKLHNKLSALDSMARHLGMYNDKLVVGVDESVSKVLALIDGSTRGLPPSRSGDG